MFVSVSELTVELTSRGGNLGMMPFSITAIWSKHGKEGVKQESFYGKCSDVSDGTLSNYAKWSSC